LDIRSRKHGWVGGQRVGDQIKVTGHLKIYIIIRFMIYVFAEYC
jgi:hypothetical protein